MSKHRVRDLRVRGDFDVKWFALNVIFTVHARPVTSSALKTPSSFVGRVFNIMTDTVERRVHQAKGIGIGSRTAICEGFEGLIGWIMISLLGKERAALFRGQFVEG